MMSRGWNALCLECLMAGMSRGWGFLQIGCLEAGISFDWDVQWLE